MICPPCRGNDHEGCPERARQLDPGLSVTDKAGSRLCDCAHEPAGTAVARQAQRGFG